MAIPRLSIKVGKVGKAEPHAAYIAREGQYAHRLERGERLEATGSGNMPAWAEHDPLIFWQAADANERKNGTTYREFEIALPRELKPAQRLDLVRDFISQEIGNTHAYQFAIHTPKAADGDEQPHVHLMFSERRLDDIDRDPGQYFKRYNKKHPERGGHQKGYGVNAGKTLTRQQRAAELRDTRERWEKLCNAHLEQAGSGVRIDMRSYKEQGIDLQPERKFLPSEWRHQKHRAAVIEYRKQRREYLSTHKAMVALIPDFKAAIAHLKENKLSIQIAKGIEHAMQGYEAWKVKKAEEEWRKQSELEQAAALAKVRQSQREHDEKMSALRIKKQQESKDRGR